MNTWKFNSSLLAFRFFTFLMFAAVLLNCGTATAQSCLTAKNSWTSEPFPAAQTGTFTATVTATPSANNVNTVIGLSNGPQSAYTKLSAIARFNPSGFIDAYDGPSAGYVASTIPYSGGTAYLFEFDVDVGTQTYTVFVTAPGGAKTLVGQALPFRAPATSLSALSAYAEVGSDAICNLVVSGGSGQTCNHVTNSWQNIPLPSQTGTFMTTLTATPSANNINTVFGLSDGAQSAYAQLSAIGRFNPSGFIDAYDGSSGGYVASTIAYSGGTAYLFEFDVNVSAQTYSVWVTPPGGTKTSVGQNLKFRASATTLNNLATFAETGSDLLCLGGGPQTITVIANDASIVQGGPVPPLTFTASPTTPALLTNPVCTTTATSSSAPGVYPIGCSGAVAPAGFVVAYVNGTLTVNPLQAQTITVTANNQTMLVKTALPAFTFSANPATPALVTNPTCSTTATGTAIGQFPITCSGAVAPTGFVVAYVSGTLTVTPPPDFTLATTPASQTVTAGNSVTYTVTVAPANGYKGTVNLSVGGVPSGATASLSSTSIGGGSGTSTLTIATTSNTSPTTVPATMTISGSDGTLTHTAQASLTINPKQTTSIDLTPWCVQLPIGSSGNPTEICPPQILTFSDQYFAPQPDGSIKFDDPGVNCVTTANSAHCRTELREVAVWQATGTNTLSATLEVTNAAGEPVIGQIHDDPAVSVRPLVELFYNYKGKGRLVAGAEQCLGGGCTTPFDLGPDPAGKFSYVISYGTVNGAVQLSVSVNGGPPMILTTPILGVGGYFKAGDYGQAATDAAVTFFAIDIVHKP